MSYTTDLTLYVQHSGEKDVQAFLDAIRTVERFGDTLERIDMAGAGGTRGFGGAVYAMGSNHFPTQELQRLMDGVQWRKPDRVVLIAQSENFGAQVIRPHYEYEQVWGDYAHAVQVVPEDDAEVPE